MSPCDTNKPMTVVLRADVTTLATINIPQINFDNKRNIRNSLFK